MAILDRRLMGAFSSLSEEAARVAAGVRAGVTVVRGDGGGHGSGVVWREDGIVLTNDHVVRADRAEVTLADGRGFEARVFRRDPERDLAALRVSARGLPAVPVGDSRGLRVGQLVLAVGNPLGLRGAVAIGIVSGVGQESRVGGRRLPEMVQADVDLYPGNSGGPLVDAEGRVVGINSMVAGPGMALAVPSHVAERFLVGGADDGVYLGVAVRQVEVPGVFARAMGLRASRGLMVFGVAEGGPAERAGLLPGDLLVALDGIPLAESEDLPRRLAEKGPHLPARLAVLRGGRPMEIVAMPRERRPRAA